MSYDVQFCIDGNRVRFDKPHHVTGGTYQVGGCDGAWLNITYNYAPFYEELWPGGSIRSLYGKTAGEVIPLLKTAVEDLGTDADENYWEPTKGNAGAALANLLELARMCPIDAVLEGD